MCMAGQDEGMIGALSKDGNESEDYDDEEADDVHLTCAAGTDAPNSSAEGAEFYLPDNYFDCHAQGCTLVVQGVCVKCRVEYCEDHLEDHECGEAEGP
jgi:hypothetical protein